MATTDQQALIETKRKNLKDLRDYHQPLLAKLNIPDVIFYGKTPFIPAGKNELYISFFKSEISSGQDLYIEFAHFDNLPMYEDRKLYKWKWNPHYESEYQQTDPPEAITSKNRYLVPVGELIIVTAAMQPQAQPEKKEGEKLSTKDIDKPRNIIEDFKLDDPNLDLPLNNMTIRDLAAILLKKPCSQKKWLNDIITS